MSFDSITYGGHSVIFLNSSELTVAIDPWLSSNPKCPTALKSKKIDLILLTHGHSDHAGEAAVIAKASGAEIVATWEQAMIMIAEGVAQDKVHPMNKGGCIKWRNLVISLVHAFHSSSYDTAKGPVYAGEACGVVVKDGKNAIYHAGDTALFSDMKLIAEIHRPSVAILPIEDRFTMGPKDAARAAGLIEAPRVVPVHYGTFDLLTGTAEAFQSACRETPGAEKIQVCTLEPGAALKL